ncbi:hypothetical protein [Phytoactinopolyspora halotolerans]|uniref:Uncharacterized protein n=1 Tax=Phytoactinopolyspora halotolerans TaxID=1981512 RepID=A0A6L9S7F3_9ACTN|nr:hypothetical protein [Phytoactinopolyspora halotolerans]NEE00584.1 hypothetical protein [Phytoactinopolyspora halotolerans]
MDTIHLLVAAQNRRLSQARFASPQWQHRLHPSARPPARSLATPLPGATTATAAVRAVIGRLTGAGRRLRRRRPVGASAASR